MIVNVINIDVIENAITVHPVGCNFNMTFKVPPSARLGGMVNYCRAYEIGEAQVKLEIRLGQGVLWVARLDPMPWTREDESNESSISESRDENPPLEIQIGFFERA